MSLDLIPRSAYNEDHEAFRATVRRFLQDEIEPNGAKWAEDGIVPKSVRRISLRKEARFARS